MKKPCIFLDRDGVIVRPVLRAGKPTAPRAFSELSFYDKVPEFLARVREKGFLSVLVTNQPDVAYGFISMNEWQRIHKEVLNLPFDKVCVCMHTDRDGCDCRKPKPGMLFSAQRALGIDMASSFMVGDTDKDMGAGRAAGVRTILINRPYNRGVSGDFKVGTLDQALEIVLWENG